MQKSHLIAVVVALSLLGVAGSAEAAKVSDFFLTGPINEAGSGESVEVIDDNDGSGDLSAGDVIKGAVVFRSINSIPLGGAPDVANSQWSGVFYLRVRAVNSLGGGLGDVVFEPDTAGFSAYLATLGDASGATSGAMVRMYESATNTLNFRGAFTPGGGKPNLTADGHIASIVAGNWFWDMGFTTSFAAADHPSDLILGSIVSTSGEGWVALGIPLTTAVINLGSEFGEGNFALNKTGGPQGTLGKQQLGVGTAAIIGDSDPTDAVHFIGSTSINGAAGYHPNDVFDATDDGDFTFLIVPLPAAAWPGVFLIGLLGLNRIRRKRMAD